MKLKISAAAAIATILAGAAFAQTVVVQPEQERVIREYVAAHEVEPVEIPDIEVTVGAVLPETVELHTIDAPDINYRYVVVEGQTLVVEPDTRKVVHIIR